MIDILNTFLAPLENYIKSYKKYIGYVFLLLSLASFGFFYMPNGIKESGEKAILVLWIILWIPIFARVFGLKIFQTMMPLRKEIGILMGTLAVVHAVSYISPNPDILGTRGFWISNGYPSAYAFGYIAYILTIPLLLTSNRWSMKYLGTKWKMLHKLVYIIVVVTVAHVVLLKWYLHFEFVPVIILVLYFGLKILEWRGFTFANKKIKKTYPKGQKWLCVPCGYIYDPALGDEADGIKAGTEFSDIPDDWRCPECGVTKADFVPVEDEDTGNLAGHAAKIIEKIYLNPVTLKLVIELTKNIPSIPGQFVTCMWSDNEGEFTRSYSIAEHTGRRITFLIKLTDLGRGARLLRDISTDSDIRIRGIFGSFVLQKSENPKIFIATGTGLSPIYNMIAALPETTHKSLYFTVSTGTELFYTEELEAIKNLDLHIHITKEEVHGHNHGRVNVDDIVAVPETEWYLCGSPKMVEEAREKLQAKGYAKVYSEEFN